MTTKSNIRTLSIALGLVSVIAAPAQAVTLNFGTDLEATDTYNNNSLIAGNVGNTESEIASLLNTWLNTNTFGAGDVTKFAKPAETGAPDGQFYVGTGYTWLIVKYDGPNGGSALFQLSGNDAWVPYDSAPTWGTGDQYAISHYSVVGRTPPPDSQTPGVPDGGSTAAMLGLGLVAMAAAARRFMA